MPVTLTKPAAATVRNARPGHRRTVLQPGMAVRPAGATIPYRVIDEITVSPRPDRSRGQRVLIRWADTKGVLFTRFSDATRFDIRLPETICEADDDVARCSEKATVQLAYTWIGTKTTIAMVESLCAAHAETSADDIAFSLHCELVAFRPVVSLTR